MSLPTTSTTSTTPPTSAPALVPDSSPDPPPKRKISRRAVLSGALGTLAVAGTGAGWALNRYVLDHVEVANASSITASNAAVATAATSGTSTATSYRSDTASVEISTVETGTGATR